MSTVGPAGRSYERIERADLERLAALAADRAEYFAAHRDWAALYAERVIAVAFCQGAALHYVAGEVGV